QIAYSQTEGYVPVTTKAQNDPGYQDYLSRAGEDNSTYYDVKLAAVQLLLDNLDNTFVTPVFNGSASLRDAAGARIESVHRALRRRQPVDEGTIAQLYEDTVDLYHLDQTSATAGKADLGPLPTTAVVLLAALAVAWAGILACVILRKVRVRRR